MNITQKQHSNNDSYVHHASGMGSSGVCPFKSLFSDSSFLGVSGGDCSSIGVSLRGDS